MALAVKVFEVFPEATVTGDGSVRLALLSLTVTAKPPDGAACVRVMVQVEEPGVTKEEGVQLRLLSAVVGGGWLTVIVPPVPEAGIG